jgi:hypothetical protein
MGCFDSVYVQCPVCSEQVEFQSKAGECLLDTFFEDDVPVQIALDIEGERDRCPKCGTTFKIISEVIKTCRVRGVRD